MVDDALWLLSAASFPRPTPLSGPHEAEGRVVTTQTLLSGDVPDGHDPVHRSLLACGLDQHIELLRHHPDLISRAGAGRSWCHNAAGPWPVPHDTLVDFTRTTPDYAWLDQFGRRGADQILANREAGAVVSGQRRLVRREHSRGRRETGRHR